MLLRRFLFVQILLLSILWAKAQKVDAWHVTAVTEEQFNSDNGRWNFSSMLDYGAEVSLWKGGQLNVNALTTYMQHDEDYLSTDPLVFSNIDAPSDWFRFSTLGLSQKLGNFTVFAGVRSSVADYFADEEISYFATSPHGIHPVVSSNFNIATYPTSALAAQLTWDITEKWRLTTTFYNREAALKLKDEFKLGDGILNMTAVNYHSDNRTIELGACSGRDFSEQRKTSFYAYDMEILNQKLALIGELGYYNVDTNKNYGTLLCQFYAAAGGVYKFDEKRALGVIGTFGKYTERIDETQIEINYTRQLGPVAVKPVLILDNNDGDMQAIGMLRLSFSLGNE